MPVHWLKAPQVQPLQLLVWVPAWHSPMSEPQALVSVWPLTHCAPHCSLQVWVRFWLPVVQPVPPIHCEVKPGAESNVNGLIVGFLSKNPELLLTKTDQTDETAYAKESPRSWLNSARVLDFAVDESIDRQVMLISGFVGNSNNRIFSIFLHTIVFCMFVFK